MSLRARLLAAISLALIAAFAAAAGLAVWQAARSVRTEVAAALASGRRTIDAALDGRQTDPADLRPIVAMFDGSRHVRAQLVDAAGSVLAESRLDPPSPPPAWFLSLAAPTLNAVVVPVASAGLALRLLPDAANEADERWQDLQEHLALLALLSVLTGASCSATLGVSLRPLAALTRGFERLGKGASEPRLPVVGPPELAALAAAFNASVAALREADLRNARLQSQIAAIADEERAELARDLHDEFGPLLFAIAAFAATGARMAAGGDAAGLPSQLRAIQDATAALQRQVREMLGRLHDPESEPLALNEALTRLTEFWRTVRPGVTFGLDLAADDRRLPDAAREALFRAAQEAMSNAVRHGSPRSVHVSVAMDRDAATLTVADDGAGGDEGPGLGLPGMRARVSAQGGVVTVARERGWTVSVTLPLAAPASREPA